MDICMMHQLLSVRDGRFIGGCTERPTEKVTVICLGTHHCLLRQWGLMTVLQRATLKPHLSQSKSKCTTADLQLSSLADDTKGMGSLVQTVISFSLCCNVKHKCNLNCKSRLMLLSKDKQERKLQLQTSQHGVITRSLR